MPRLAPLAFALAVLPGCFVYADEPARPPLNASPLITYADAGCEPDDYYHDFVWYFDADVDDADGPADVDQVYVDVYDSYDGTWVDGFDLYPDQGITWYSDWVGSSTYLDCTYPDYVVDFTAVDIFGATDVVSVDPLTW
jgi:hypothetical protein